MNKCVLQLAALSVIGLIAGCGTPGPKLVPADGTIKLKGEPLGNAAIIVHYPDANIAQGTSDANGKFSLTYLGRNGAVPGAGLKVSVYKGEGAAPVAAETNTGGPPSDAELKEKMKKMMAPVEQGAKSATGMHKSGPKSLIDTKYNSPTSSGLTLEIPANGSKELVIELQ